MPRIIHAEPAAGHDVTPCCGADVHSLPPGEAVLTLDPNTVTCAGPVDILQTVSGGHLHVEACQIIDLSSGPVSVRGEGELSAEGRAALAVVVEAARRKLEADGLPVVDTTRIRRVRHRAQLRGRPWARALHLARRCPDCRKATR